MGYHLSDYTISLFPDIETGYHPLYSDFTNHITYDLIGVTPEELYHSAPVGFPAAYSICGALIKINNKYTPMVIATTSSGCRVKNDSTQEIGSYKQVKYNGYGYYVCDNIPGLADNITVQGYMLKEIDKNYNSMEEAVIDFLSRLDKLPTPCKRIYLLPEPTKKAHDYFSEYNSPLYYGNGAAFYAKPITSTEEWWAIGTVLKDTAGYYHPIIISTVRDYAKLLDTQLVVNNSNIVEFEYNGFTYYINSTISQSILTKGSSTTFGSETIYYYSGPYGCCEFIPYDNSSEEKIIEMGKSLLAQYEFEGGKLKSIAGKISAIKDLDEKGNSRGKTFSRAHAKTVYTSLADNKTLDQDLNSIYLSLNELITKSARIDTNAANIHELSRKVEDISSPDYDSALSTTSTNAVENKVVTAALAEKLSNGNVLIGGINLNASRGRGSLLISLSSPASKLGEESLGLGSALNDSGHTNLLVGESNDTDTECKNSIVVGYENITRGKNNCAIGESNSTQRNNAVAFNYWCTAWEGGFAQGAQTYSSGSYSHSEGYDTAARGNYSHAEGYSTYQAHGVLDLNSTPTFIALLENRLSTTRPYSLAFGKASHAEGKDTVAIHQYTHTEGIGTIAWQLSSSSPQHVEGKYNAVDKEGTTNYLHIVGNGTSETDRSNAYTLDVDGNAYYAGTITCKSIITEGGSSSVDISNFIEYGNDITD